MSASKLTLSLMLTLPLLTGACDDKNAASAGPLGNEVAMTVTDKGFEPPNIRVKKDQPVKLTITRKSDATCATEIVIDEHAIKTALPLNEAVVVTFTPKASGKLKYGCAMEKMIGGVISIE